MRVAVARNIVVARDATEKHEAIRRQTQIHERLLSLSRGSESRPGSHILGCADTPEAHSLIGTAEEVEAGAGCAQGGGRRLRPAVWPGLARQPAAVCREGDVKVRCAASALIPLVPLLGVRGRTSEMGQGRAIDGFKSVSAVPPIEKVLSPCAISRHFTDSTAYGCELVIPCDVSQGICLLGHYNLLASIAVTVYSQSWRP
jgi:hypothetical protein